MAGSQIERVFSVLESLTRDPRGVPMQVLAEQLQIPKSATHRLLAELIRLGYVRQNPDNLRYHLSTKLVAMGFRYLSGSGADIVQPVLDRLAQETGELVRLGVIEGQRQTWIAKSQGARSGLRYDPDMGREAPLFYTASGHAWLASLSERVLGISARRTLPQWQTQHFFNTPVQSATAQEVLAAEWAARAQALVAHLTKTNEGLRRVRHPTDLNPGPARAPAQALAVFAGPSHRARGARPASRL